MGEIIVLLKSNIVNITKFKYFLISSLVIFIQSCSIVNSYKYYGDGAESPKTNASGSYYLAKHWVNISVVGKNLNVTTEVGQDPETLMEIGLSLSPTADDKITVDYKNGLLAKIVTVADDQSSDILGAIASAAGNYRNKKIDQTTAPEVFNVIFDPFDPIDALNKNDLLRQVPGQENSCVEVELVSGIWSGGCPNRYSLNPDHPLESPKIELVSSFDPKEPGIYYRRPIEHRVHVVKNGRTASIKKQKFSNIAPILRIDINRTLFVKHETTVNFTNGELTQIIVTKPSEALKIVSLPVVIIDAYLGGIVNSFGKHKEVQTAKAALIAEQKKVLEAEKDLLQAQTQAAQSGDVKRSLLLDNVSANRNQITSNRYRNIKIDINGDQNTGNTNYDDLFRRKEILECRKQTGKTATECDNILIYD